MNRLTARSKNGEAYYPVCIEACDGDLQDCRNCDIDKDICDRLAAYEDTDLSPEEVKAALRELERYRGLGTAEELNEAAYNASL